MKYFNKKLFILSFILAFLLITPYLFSGFYLGDDAFFHLSRIEGLKNTIIDKQFLAKIYPFKNFGFGYASPIFYCDIFLYLPAILLLFNLPLIPVYLFFLFLFLVITSYSMGITAFLISKNEKTMLFAALFYSLSPYHLFDIYQRASLGEIMAMSFFPLLIISLYYLIKLKSDKYYYLAFSMTLIVCSHNISLIMAILYLIVYLGLNYRNLSRKVFINIFKAGILAISLASFFIFPMLEFLSVQDYFLNHIQNTSNLASYALEFAALFNFKEVLSINNLNLGILMSLALCYQLIRAKYRKYAILVLLLLISTTNLIPYRYLGFMTIIQFPFRFFIIISPIASLLAADFFSKFYYKIGIIIASLLLVNSSFVISGILENLNKTNANFVYSDILDNTYGQAISSDYGYTSLELINAEYLPYSTILNYDKFKTVMRYDNFDVVDGQLEKNFTSLKIKLNQVYPNLNIMLPISYYPGYHLYKTDSNYHKIEEIPSFKGSYYPLVTFKAVQSDEGYYLLDYEATLIQKASLLLSFLAILYSIYKLKKH